MAGSSCECFICIFCNAWRRCWPGNYQLISWVFDLIPTGQRVPPAKAFFAGVGILLLVSDPGYSVVQSFVISRVRQPKIYLEAGLSSRKP